MSLASTCHFSNFSTHSIDYPTQVIFPMYDKLGSSLSRFTPASHKAHTHLLLLSCLFPFLSACGLRFPETFDHRADGEHLILSLLHGAHTYDPGCTDEYNKKSKKIDPGSALGIRIAGHRVGSYTHVRYLFFPQRPPVFFLSCFSPSEVTCTPDNRGTDFPLVRSARQSWVSLDAIQLMQ